MANHEVKIREVPSLKIGNSDVIFDIKSDNEMLGSLCVSRGHVVWRPANHSFGHWLNWADFSKVLETNGKRRKVNF